MDDLYRTLNLDKDLVVGFLILFSRFEYALKRTVKYAKGDEKGVEPDWDKFAAEQDSAFRPDKSPEINAAVAYIESNPPKKQVLRAGTLGWKVIPRENGPRLVRLLRDVRCVRNNLFHGGKFPEPDGPIEEPSRNARLLQSCRTVLSECLSLNDDVRIWFWNAER